MNHYPINQQDGAYNGMFVIQDCARYGNMERRKPCKVG